VKATTLLEHQQRNLQELCEAVHEGSASVRASLLPQLAGDLAALLAVEERVFYPAASAALHEDAWSGSGRSWHDRALQSLDRALDAPVDGAEFERAIAELRTAVDLHAQEEQALFPRLERALDGGTMRALGVSMMSLYHSAVEAGYRHHS
jgi:hypothetical protein